MGGYARHTRKFTLCVGIALTDIAGLSKKLLPSLYDARGPKKDKDFARFIIGTHPRPDPLEATFDIPRTPDMLQETS